MSGYDGSLFPRMMCCCGKAKDEVLKLTVQTEALQPVNANITGATLSGDA